MPFSWDDCFVSLADVLSGSDIAVAVSGGPDSMALAALLFRWCKKQGSKITLHALTVDHGLRAESKAEAAQVGKWLSDWPGVKHHVLAWQGEKREARIQEEARAARYKLMEEYCRERGIKNLFLAHHQDDQAETFLLRLAAGSGLDGLAGMAIRQPYKSIILLRPLLDIPKADLVAFCRAENIPFVDDPSNHKDRFARVRLRNSVEVLEREGLSSKRLATTSRRLARVRDMLEAETDKFMVSTQVNKNTNRIDFTYSSWRDAYKELVFRSVKRIFQNLGLQEDGGQPYGPRTERIEVLVTDILKSDPFRKRTLGGVVIVVDEKNDLIIFTKEAPKKG
ncbi:MAG: tRNA lysidine(34) synthetase TilS [Alphaproteobacteria bacterium]|nr:tRNA lysidine(34) synthetase TilS [Alphaproteobacteria bacterium]MCD8520153.1 tRNA lysidine(34) synthetase TilS [Alphaproteobacteria bacterium]MCD8571753.1 tRNA lysidine(34) synthetase TilS [Alphaproteobacteria bacterium]